MLYASVSMARTVQAALLAVVDSMDGKSSVVRVHKAATGNTVAGLWCSCTKIAASANWSSLTRRPPLPIADGGCWQSSPPPSPKHESVNEMRVPRNPRAERQLRHVVMNRVFDPQFMIRKKRQEPPQTQPKNSESVSCAAIERPDYRA